MHLGANLSVIIPETTTSIDKLLSSSTQSCTCIFYFCSNLALLSLQILCAHLPDSTITISLKTKCSTLGKICIPAHQILIDNGGFKGLKNATFPQRSNCSVTLYQDAHHHYNFHPPGNLCGTPRKLWEDVYKAIDDAKYLVYIAGWSFNPKLVLVSDKILFSFSSSFHISNLRNEGNMCRFVILKQKFHMHEE